ncbi:MAG: hypothetical protein Q8L09_03700 [Candidatus Moranbacteria bacterium]|nr:hypothetical protein [Candidatus Moranbacteria bacterium]
MKKGIFLLALTTFILFSGNAQAKGKAVGRLTALVATESLRDKGYNFTGGHWFTEQRSFQKKAKGGGNIIVILGADEEGKEVKSFFISLPLSAQDEVKEAVLTAVLSLASARGAKSPDLIEVGTDLLLDLWPKKIAKYWGTNTSGLKLKGCQIAVSLRNIGGGKVQIQIN